MFCNTRAFFLARNHLKDAKTYFKMQTYLCTPGIFEIFTFNHIRNQDSFPTLPILSKSDIRRGSYGRFTWNCRKRLGMTANLTDRHTSDGPPL